MQIVYLSNRPAILNKTLEQVVRFMPFVKRALIICPEVNIEKIKSSSLKLEFISEEKLLKGISKKQLDHQSLNYFLRSSAISNELIDDQFIMSDDDARPVCPLDEKMYIEEGKHHCYFYYNLEQWHFRQTDFDQGQQNTYAVLMAAGLPLLSFASHMPQVINKDVFLESAKMFNSYSSKFGICEWTSYFNYGLHNHRNKFHNPKPYETLGWPNYPGDWPWYVKPGRFSFENFNPEAYHSKGLFNSTVECPTLENYQGVLAEKIRRHKNMECGRYIAPVVQNDPWLTKSIMHRLLYRLVRYGNGYMRKVMISERNKV